MTTNQSSSTTKPQGVVNYSILAIPTSYVLALAPQYYAFARGMIASNYAATNVLPRTNLDILKTKIPEATWQHLVRARGAHLNALEGFPMFAGAMIAGNWAGVPTRDLNIAAAQYLGVRVVYTTLYMTVKGEIASYLRSSAYAWSLAIPIWVLWKVHKRLNDGIGEDETFRGAFRKNDEKQQL